MEGPWNLKTGNLKPGVSLSQGCNRCVRRWAQQEAKNGWEIPRYESIAPFQQLETCGDGRMPFI